VGENIVDEALIAGVVGQPAHHVVGGLHRAGRDIGRQVHGWFLEVSRIGGAAYVVSLPRRIKAPRGPGRSGRLGRDWRGLVPGLPAPALLRRPVIALAAPLTRIDGGRRRSALLEEEAKA